MFLSVNVLPTWDHFKAAVGRSFTLYEGCVETVMHSGFIFCMVNVFTETAWDKIDHIVYDDRYVQLRSSLAYVYRTSTKHHQPPKQIWKCYSLVLQIAVLISIGFVGCWAPYGIVSLWSIYRPGDSIPPEVSMLPCLFAKSSTVYNPFIYYIFSKTFKREVNQLGRLCGRSNICRTSDAKNGAENTIYLVCDANKSKPGAEEQTIEKSRENETQLNQ